jgi:hypothetical protein
MFAVFTIGQRDFDKGSDATNKRQEVIKNRLLKISNILHHIVTTLQFLNFLQTFSIIF